MSFRFTETICQSESNWKRQLKMRKRDRNKNANYFRTEIVKIRQMLSASHFKRC